MVAPYFYVLCALQHEFAMLISSLLKAIVAKVASYQVIRVAVRNVAAMAGSRPGGDAPRVCSPGLAGCPCPRAAPARRDTMALPWRAADASPCARVSRPAPRREGQAMTQHLGALALLVADYDEAIAWYTRALGFELVEDTDMGGGKRWVLLAPPGSCETRHNRSRGGHVVRLPWLPEGAAHGPIRYDPVERGAAGARRTCRRARRPGNAVPHLPLAGAGVRAQSCARA